MFHDNTPVRQARAVLPPVAQQGVKVLGGNNPLGSGRRTISPVSVPVTGSLRHLLPPKELDNLLRRVRGTPRTFGLNTHTWTLELLAYHLFQQTGVAISAERVRQLLIAHDFVCRRPKIIVRSPDPQKREKMDKIAEILFSPGNYVVLFEDETNLNLNPGIQRCWMPRGEQKEILTPGRNKKAYVFGVVDASRSDVQVRITGKKNAKTFVAFLRQILCANPGRRIYLIIDNWGMHDAKVVRAFLALHRRLVFVHLPSYSPLLNIIERLWNPAKARLTKNAEWASIEELWAAARGYFRSAAMRSGRAFRVNLREWLEIRKDLLAFT